MNNPLTQVRQTVWSRYWAHGIAHSCGGSYAGRYEGALAQFWLSAFAGLNPGARVLDIATGNGALPQLLLDADKAASMSCDAIDLARLEPHWLKQLPESRRSQIRFHGQQAAEALPFADGQFDMVVSQYGLEYTDLSRTVPELLRVLVAGGKIRLISHHVDARPVVLAGTELDHLAWMNQDQGLLDTAAALIEPMARASTEEGRASLSLDKEANAARERFNLLQSMVTELAKTSDCPDVLMDTRQAIVGIFNLAINQGADASGQAMRQLRQELADSVVRLRELRDFALDEPRARHLCAALAGADGKAALSPVSDQSVLMGWSISVEPEHARPAR